MVTGPAATRGPTTQPPTTWPWPAESSTASPDASGGAGGGSTVPVTERSSKRRRRGAAHGDVPDGARRAEDTDAAAPAARVLGDAGGDVGARRHLEDVRVER